MLVEAAVSSTNTNRAGQTDPVPAPIAARQRIKTVLDARERGTEEKVKQAPLTLAKQQLAEQNREIARLEDWRRRRRMPRCLICAATAPTTSSG